MVVRSTREGRATHVCPASAWDRLRATSATRLGNGVTVAVLPLEWAENQGTAMIGELEGMRFPFLEELRQALEG